MFYDCLHGASEEVMFVSERANGELWAHCDKLWANVVFREDFSKLLYKVGKLFVQGSAHQQTRVTVSVTLILGAAVLICPRSLQYNAA